AATLNCDLTPQELRQLNLKFQQGDKELGHLQVTGPLDMRQQEGRLTFDASSIDRQVLNLVGGAQGLDFGQTKLNAHSLIDVSQRGSVIAGNGKLTGNDVGIGKNGQVTPPLDVDLNYQFTVDLGEKTGLLRALRLQVKEKSAEILHASL